MLNKVFLIGRLTKDPTITYLSSGTPVVDFTIAHNRRYKDKNGEWKEESSFFEIKGIGKGFDDLGAKLNKGDTVLIEGELRQEKWETKDGNKASKIRVYIHNVRILKRSKQYGDMKKEVSETLKKKNNTPFEENDDIPF